MYTRSRFLNSISIPLLLTVCCRNVLASTIRTYGGTFNLPIPAEPDQSEGWMDDAIIEVPDHFNIHDIDVAIDITHTKVFDLQLILYSPAGIPLCLNMYNFDEYFDGENYTDTIFDDEAETPIEDGTAPFTGRFRPRAGNFLQVFDGQDTYGNWKLRIYDAWPADTGTLNSYELIITVPEPATFIFLTIGQGLAILLRPRRR